MHQPLAYIHSNADIARNVVIDPFVTIEKNVIIGDGSWIGILGCCVAVERGRVTRGGPGTGHRARVAREVGLNLSVVREYIGYRPWALQV